MYGKSTHDAQSSKSRTLNKVIDLIIDIAFFEEQCVVIKGLLYSDRLKQHMVTIVIYK